jgi:hypothetical protein
MSDPDIQAALAGWGTFAAAAVVFVVNLLGNRAMRTGDFSSWGGPVVDPSVWWRRMATRLHWFGTLLVGLLAVLAGLFAIFVTVVLAVDRIAGGP